jgi:hypothetical protein
MDVNYLGHQIPDGGAPHVTRRTRRAALPAAISGTEPPQLPFTVSDVPLPGGRRGTH